MPPELAWRLLLTSPLPAGYAEVAWATRTSSGDALALQFEPFVFPLDGLVYSTPQSADVW